MSAEHMIALRAVCRTSDFPNCPDWRLQSAAEAGLIQFVAWPSGHWQMTPAGRQYLWENSPSED